MKEIPACTFLKDRICDCPMGPCATGVGFRPGMGDEAGDCEFLGGFRPLNPNFTEKDEELDGKPVRQTG